jgi:peptidoglycan/xylan/chitin deacetylase (PgdA/CDA1 family)
MKDLKSRALNKFFALTINKIIGSITHVSTDKAVSPTFMISNPVFTPKVLHVLKKHNAKATFFAI